MLVGVNPGGFDTVWQVVGQAEWIECADEGVTGEVTEKGAKAAGIFSS